MSPALIPPSHEVASLIAPSHELAVGAAISILALSMRGRLAVNDLLHFLDNGGIGLDGYSQQAVMTLLVAAWTGGAGTALDAMRQLAEGGAR